MNFTDENTAIFSPHPNLIIPGQRISLLGTEHIEHYDLFILPMSELNSCVSNILKRKAGSDNSEELMNVRLKGLMFRLTEVLKLVETGASLMIILDALPCVERHHINFFPIISLLKYCGRDGSFPLNSKKSTSHPKAKIWFTSYISGDNLNAIHLAPSKHADHPPIVSGYLDRKTETSGLIIFTPYIKLSHIPPTKESEDAKIIIDAMKNLGSGQVSRPKLGGVPIEKDDEPNNRIVLKFFLDEVRKLLKASVQSNLPAWAHNLDLSEEVKIKEEIEDKKKAIEKIRSEIDGHEQVLKSNEWLKYLFTEKGTTLEDVVLKALNELDLHTVAGPEKRTDLLSFNKDINTIYAIEVKGHDNGSMKDYDVDQCKRWIAEVSATFKMPPEERDVIFDRYAEILKENFGFEVPFEEGQETPTVKGVLIGNTYKKTSALDRKSIQSHRGEHFTPTQETTMKHSNIAGITTLQLLGMYDLHRKDPDKAKEELQKFLNTDGVYTGFSDYSKFLIETESVEEDTED